jgi:hypothetical protein
MDNNDNVYVIISCLNMSSLGAMMSRENNGECFDEE